MRSAPLLAIVLAACAGASAQPATPEEPAVVGSHCSAECRAVSECAPGKGHIALGSCGAAHLVCCAPQGSCGGQEDFVCCAETAQFRPVCRDGRLQCQTGQARAPQEGCPSPAAREVSSTPTVDGLDRRAVDLNGDGRADLIKYYSGGELVREEADLDFDGVPDVRSFYEGGRLVRKEYDFDFDGKPDKVERY